MTSTTPTDRSGGPTPRLTCTVVTPFGVLGGAEGWLLGLLDTVPERLEVEVWMLQDGPLRDELVARGVTVEVIPTGASPLALARTAVHLSRRLRRSGTDVLLANGVKAAATAVPAARLTGVPVVWAKHDFSWDRELGRLLGASSDLVIATSDSVGAATARRDTVVVPPPRPTSAAAPAARAREFWAANGLPPSEAPTVAMLARLVPYKGVDTAIQALALDPASSWRLVVVGADDPSAPGETRRLRDLARDLGVERRVFLVGEVARAGHWLAGFDAVAVLTRPDGTRFGREGYSLVALEALNAGVPLVGAEGNPEVERMARIAGQVVACDDPAAVADALAVLGDPQARTRHVAAARDLIRSHPDARTAAGLVVDALADVAGRPGAGLAGPSMTVLTCFLNEEANVDAIVSSVLAQLEPEDEYILVDDRSSDGTGDKLARWAETDSRVRVLEGPGVNAAAARNVGFAQARHAHVACIDAGCAPRPGWLAALRAPFAHRPPPDLVVGVYDVDEGGGDPVRQAGRLALFPSVAQARRRTPLVRVTSLFTGRRFDASRLDTRSMACGVRAWERAGGFDATLGAAEDAAFGEAVLATGGTSVLALDAEVVWAQHPTIRATARMYVRYGEGGARAGSRSLIGRDLVRAGSYLVAPLALAAGGPRTRLAVAGAAAGYLAGPLALARRQHSRPATVALIPVMLATKDLAKAYGCLKGLAVERARASGSDSRDD